MTEIVGLRTKVQGQRDTTHQNLFQQNDPSQHLPTALQPALDGHLTPGCRQGNTHRSHQCASLHTPSCTCRDSRGFFFGFFLAYLLFRYFGDCKFDFKFLSLVQFTCRMFFLPRSEVCRINYLCVFCSLNTHTGKRGLGFIAQ